jgi:hypothetical protein
MISHLGSLKDCDYCKIQEFLHLPEQRHPTSLSAHGVAPMFGTSLSATVRGYCAWSTHEASERTECGEWVVVVDLVAVVGRCSSYGRGCTCIARVGRAQGGGIGGREGCEAARVMCSWRLVVGTRRRVRCPKFRMQRTGGGGGPGGSYGRGCTCSTCVGRAQGGGIG